MSKQMKPDPSKRHPQAGKHVIIQHGHLKGTAVKVVDFVQSQFQGKSIKSLRDRADLSPEINALENRKFTFSEKTVFVIVPETPPRYILVDDSELQIKPTLKSIDGGKEDDTRTTTTGNIEGAGLSGDGEGRTLPSEASSTEDKGVTDIQGQGDSQVGSGAGSDEKPVSRPDQSEVGTGDKAESTIPKTDKPAKSNRGNRSTSSK